MPISEDFWKLNRVGRAVDEGQAVYEEGCGKASQKKIFYGCFCGLFVFSPQAGKSIAGNGEDLQAQKDDKEVGRGNHDGYTRQSHEQQGIILAVICILEADVFYGNKNDKACGYDQDKDEEEREIIEEKAATKISITLVPEADADIAADKQGEEGDKSQVALVLFLEKDLKE
jgi:hypothetical protein